MKDTMGEYTIPAVSESPIMDVFPYFTGEDDDIERLESFNNLKASVAVINEEDEKLAMADSLTTEVV